MTVTPFMAVTRFGLGAKPGEVEAAADPRAWLLRQVAGPVPLPQGLANRPSGAERWALFVEARRRGDAQLQNAIQTNFRDLFATDAAARTAAQVDSDQPYRERLVAFWSNHFTVSVQRPPVLGLAEPFEREAIRPHVTAKFADMLLAVARHPAMLNYLDNAQSIGPNSRVGLRRGRGLNENLAREILELHTLGVAGGYTQNDVREFAKILTGWSVGGADSPRDGFRYRPEIHEPGSKTLLGVAYREAGEQEAIEAFKALSRHRATARHIATKLARHFVADDPPADVIDKLAAVYRDSDGDLGALARALIDLPEAWEKPLAKVKTPIEFIVSALRASAVPVGPRERANGIVQAMRLLGQTPFAAPSPAGWPDRAQDWIGPESVLRRAEWAMAAGERIAAIKQPMALLDVAIGPHAQRETRLAVERAPSAGDAIALVLASPEFQRR